MSVTMRFGEGTCIIQAPSARKGAPQYGHPLHARIRAAVRRCIADEIERLVDVLDALDGDTDMEDGGDSEPSLGWPNPIGERLDAAASYTSFRGLVGSPDDDRELDEAEGRQMDAGDEREGDRQEWSD